MATKTQTKPVAKTRKAAAPKTNIMNTIEKTATEFAPGLPIPVATEAPKSRAVKLGMPMYEITTDGILSSEIGIAAGNGTLSGRVSQADIEALGADFEWLLKTGQIIEAGYDVIQD